MLKQGVWYVGQTLDVLQAGRRWEYSTDGTSFKSIPVEETWADSVAKPNLKVTYDGVGIIKGNYLRCKVTDANGNVFYCEPLKVIQHFDFT